MAKKNGTERLTAKQIKAKLARGEDRTDWAKIARTTKASLEASIEADRDDIAGEPDWTQAVMGVPGRKEHVSLRIDHDVLEWFRARGKSLSKAIVFCLRWVGRSNSAI